LLLFCGELNGLAMNELTDIKNFLTSLLRPLINEAVSESFQNIKQQAQPEAKEEQPDLIKIAEAEAETGFKKGYIYELVSKQAIPFHKRGHSLRFSRKELRDWIKAGRPAILQQAVENMATEHIVKRKGVKL
jgi:excisionase family DNA binding protein